MNNRLEELEVKIAFQEQMIETLNETVISQAEELKYLKSAITLLSKKFKQLDLDNNIESESSPPPHY
ncbi:SlyX family protein [Gynuella sp.]|uniref:SlyX family protein n=1 Tax=Gynuella sp. TaxID=2969146 RepID=UPI003D1456C0